MHRLFVVAVWYATSFTLCSGFTQFIRAGGHTYGFITELFFDVFSSTELHCFYEEFELYSDISISARAVDMESQTIRMKIVSPSKNISKWYKGVNQAEFSRKLHEAGIYEICTKVAVKGTRHVRLMLVIYAHHAGTMQKANKLQEEQEERTEKLKGSMNRIRSTIGLASFAMKHLKSTRDTQLQIKNANYIDLFSSVQIIIIPCTAILQVFVIRKFFSTNSYY